MNKISILILFLLISYSDIFSQPYQRKWIQNFGNDSVQARFEIIKTGIDSHDNLFVLSNRDSGSYQKTIWLTKYDNAGSILWERVYVNSNYYSDAIAVDLSIDPNDNIIVGGYTPIGLQQENYLILKYDNNGNLIWQRDVDGPASEDDLLVASKTDANGNIYVTGNAQTSGQPYYDQDVMTCKFDSSGNLVWKSYFEYPTNPNPSNYISLASFDSKGTLIATGNFNSGNIIKIDSTGSLQWLSSYHLNGVTSIIEGENDNIYLGGGSSTDAMEKMDSNGIMIRMMQSPFTGNCVINDLIFRNNKIYATGFTGTNTVSAFVLMTDTVFQNTLTDSITVLNKNLNGLCIFETAGIFTIAGRSSANSNNNDLFAARYDSSLQRNWTYFYIDSLNQQTRFIDAVCNQHGDLFIGSAFYTTGQTYAVFAVDSMGIDSWHDIRIDYQSSYDEGLLINHDHSGNIIVMGTNGVNNQTNGVLLKYDATGNLIWRYVSPSPHGNFQPTQLITDQNNNIYICGNTSGAHLTCIDSSGSTVYTLHDSAISEFSSMTIDNNGNIYLMAPTNATINYIQLIKADAGGNVIWKKLLSDSAYTSGKQNLFYSPSNFLYCAYTSISIPGHQQDIAVSKIDTSGNVIWKTLFNSGASELDIEERAVMDANENIIVAGTSDSIHWETIVLKFDSSGQLTWQNRFANFSNGINAPHDVAADANGNVYVTGRSDTLLSYSMCLTTMISPNGHVKWSERYYTQFTTGLALTYDAGNVFVSGSEFDFNSHSNLLFLVYDTSGTLLFMDTVDSRGSLNSGSGNDIVADGSGCYYVTGQTDSYLKMSEVTTVKYCNSTVSVEEFNPETDVTVFPVPASQFIRIQSAEKIIDRCEIFSVEGKLMLEKKINGNEDKMEIRLSPGVYLLKIFRDKEVVTRRITIL